MNDATLDDFRVMAGDGRVILAMAMARNGRSGRTSTWLTNWKTPRALPRKTPSARPERHAMFPGLAGGTGTG
jgi:hypothetical protein